MDEGRETALHQSRALDLVSVERGSRKARIISGQLSEAVVTPLQAAKAHCANYQADGSCLSCVGIGIRDDGSLFHLWPSKRCVIGCYACPYFEEIVLPQVPVRVAEKYRKSLPAEAKTTIEPRGQRRLCPDCNKRELEPRKRYCETCARIRRRKSFQTANSGRVTNPALRNNS